MKRVRELLREGRLEELEDLIESLSPAQAMHARAALELARHQPQQALASIGRSLELEVGFSQRNTLAVCLLECGRLQEARAVLGELLAEQPDNADLWFNLARAQGGAQALREALRCRPGWRAAEWMLIDHLRKAGQPTEALALLRRDLSTPAARLLEAEILFEVGRYADCSRLCLGLLQEQTDWDQARRLLFRAVWTAGEFLRDERLADELERGLGLSHSYALVPAVWRSWPARQALLVGLLHHDQVADWPLEQWLTQWRRGWRGNPESAALAEALAVHNFTNEFCFLETDGEAQDLTPEHPAYPLYRALPVGAPGPAEVVRRHVEEPAREAEFLKRFAPLIKADVVARQYEENPYPRWRELEDEGPSRPFRDWSNPRVLVAGCGTGRHAFLCARRYSGARVWGVDVSARSLAYAARQGERLGETAVRFLRADLLHLDEAELPDRFELIESVGVLHHLASPLAGLQALVRHLAAKGEMRLGLYSRRARAGLEPARRLARRLRHLPLRELRARLVVDLAPVDLAFLTQFRDFYSLSGLRDLLLHEREHEFDLAEVGRLLTEAGLAFSSFDCLSESVRLRFTERFGQSRLQDLDCWDLYEQENPNIFRGMYLFWCVRSDQAGSDQTGAAGKFVGPQEAG